MDFLLGVAELIGNGIAAAIEWATGWRPDERTKLVIDWIGALSSALLGVWGVIALIRGGGGATKQDIDKLRAELLAALAARETAAATAGREPASAAVHAGFAQDLNAAIDTLLEAGQSKALEDTTGAAAEAAIDALIAERAGARERVAKSEAALWRQKGALAFLHDTSAALRAYTRATELDPDDAGGWNKLGHLQDRIGDLDAAAMSYQKVLSLGAETESPELLSVAIGNLGTIYQKRGALDQAEGLYRRALALYEAMGQGEGVAVQYSNLGAISRTRGDLNHAEALFRSALAMLEPAGSRDKIADLYDQLGQTYLGRGNLDQAEAHFRKSLALNEELDRPEGMAVNCGNLGIVYGSRNELEHAEEMFQRALVHNRSIDRKEGMASNFGNLGSISLKRGDLEQARRMYEESLLLNKAIKRKQGEAVNRANLGNIAKMSGDSPAACVHWRQALELYREMGATPMIEKIEELLRDAGDSAA